MHMIRIGVKMTHTKSDSDHYMEDKEYEQIHLTFAHQPMPYVLSSSEMMTQLHLLLPHFDVEGEERDSSDCCVVSLDSRLLTRFCLTSSLCLQELP